jgi:hypothetical protein
MDAFIVVGSASVVIIAIGIAWLVRSRGRHVEKRRKTMMIAAALPFVRPDEPTFVAAPEPRHAPLDDDGPTTRADYASMTITPVPSLDPAPVYPRRFARATSVPEGIEGPTIRGPAVPPPRPPTVKNRDATIRAAIRANTLHATIKPKR